MSTPRRTIYENTSLVRQRRLPIAGNCLVKIGDQVTFDSPVLSTEIKGDLYIIRISEKLGIDAESLENGLNLKVGSRIEEGETIFFRKGFFAFLNLEYKSPIDGVVEFISTDTGHIGVRLDPTKLSVNAFIPGQILEIENSRNVTIAANVGLLQGIVGYGSEGVGRLCFLENKIGGRLELSDLEGISNVTESTIIVGGTGFTKEFLDSAKEKNVIGIITASLKSEDVTSILNTSVFGNSPPYGVDEPIIIIVEGFGEIVFSDRAVEFFKKNNGKIASLSGITQIRAGAIRPELIVHDPDVEKPVLSETTVTIPKIGDLMRVVRGSHFGLVGKIVNLPKSIQVLPSGVETYVAEIELGAESIKVSLANLESI